MVAALNVGLVELGPHFHKVRIGNTLLWFSYETCVAFHGEDGMVISENVWSKTTGKHLNYLSTDQSVRVPHTEFEARLKKALGTGVNGPASRRALRDA